MRASLRPQVNWNHGVRQTWLGGGYEVEELLDKFHVTDHRLNRRDEFLESEVIGHGKRLVRITMYTCSGLDMYGALKSVPLAQMLVHKDSKIFTLENDTEYSDLRVKQTFFQFFGGFLWKSYNLDSREGDSPPKKKSSIEHNDFRKSWMQVNTRN